VGKTLKVVCPIVEEGDSAAPVSGAEVFIFDVKEMTVFQSNTHCFVVVGKKGEARCVAVASTSDVQSKSIKEVIGIGVPAFRTFLSVDANEIERLQKAGQPLPCRYFALKLDNGESDFLAVDSGHRVYLENEQGDTMKRLA